MLVQLWCIIVLSPWWLLLGLLYGYPVILLQTSITCHWVCTWCRFSQSYHTEVKTGSLGKFPLPASGLRSTITSRWALWRHKSRASPSVYSTVYSGADERKHQSSASLAFVRGIRWWLVNSPHKGSATRKIFPFDDVIMRRVPFSLVCVYSVLNLGSSGPFWIQDLNWIIAA